LFAPFFAVAPFFAGFFTMFLVGLFFARCFTAGYCAEGFFAAGRARRLRAHPGRP
jgi:hypothetical protein